MRASISAVPLPAAASGVMRDAMTMHARGTPVGDTMQWVMVSGHSSVCVSLIPHVCECPRDFFAVTGLLTVFADAMTQCLYVWLSTRSTMSLHTVNLLDT